MSPDEFELNFAVPSQRSLNKISRKYDVDASQPGFLEEALRLFGEINKNQDIELAFDGKNWRME